MTVKDWKTQESDIIADHYINKTKPIRIIVLGAGISGIAFAYKAKQLENVSFTIYDKNFEFGGTWVESNYPGVSCDVPAHCYTFTWAGFVCLSPAHGGHIFRVLLAHYLCRNPDWSRVYASGREIAQYFQKLAREYGAYDNAKLGHKITAAVWDDLAAVWKVTVQNLETGETFVDEAEVFINSGGVLK